MHFLNKWTEVLEYEPTLFWTASPSFIVAENGNKVVKKQ